MTDLKRVALVSFHGCPLIPVGEGKAGGMNVYVRELSRNLAQMGVQVDLFTRRHSVEVPEVETLAQGARIIHVDGGPPEADLGDAHLYLRRFLKDVLGFQAREGVQYNLVHSHYWLSGWVGTRLARQWGVPHVVNFHTLAKVKNQARVGEAEPLRRERAEKRAMVESRRVIAATPHERDAIVRLYRVPPEKIEIVPCGVDLTVFHPLDQEAARQKLCLGREEVLLYVGRVEPLKNVELLLRTAAIMDGGHSGCQVLIIGGDSKGRQVELLKSLTKKLGIEDRVKFVGRVAQEMLPLYYNAADVCVVPSYYESFSLVALEAMACGKPVVASRVGGLPWVVEHARTGYLVPYRCPEPFANWLETLLSSEALRRSMGLAAHQRARRMSWESVTKKMVEVYGRVLAEARD